MGKVIMIASGKGGTGKTTAAANLGTAIAAAGKLTVLVDMDIGMRNLDVALGLENEILYDISDITDGVCSVDDVLVSGGENLYFLPAPQTKNPDDLDSEKLKELWETLRNRFEYCIVDCPAGLGGGFIHAAGGAGSAVVVTVPETAAMRDADRVISALEEFGIDDVHLVINRVRADMINQGIMMNVDDCVDVLSIPLIGIVPEDAELMISSLKGETAVSNPESRAGKAFSNIAYRIMGAEIPIMDFEEHIGIMGRLKNFFGRKNSLGY